MIEILESPKHLVALKIAGSITGEDIEKAYKATDGALETNERVSFFAETGETLEFTLEGFLKDLWNGLGQLGRLSKYYRAAVVTDKGWLATMARVEGLVFSSIDVRVFEPADRDKAFVWASEKPEPLPEPAEPERSIHFLQTTSESVFAYEVNGRIRERDIKLAVEAMKPFFDREGKFNALVRMKDFAGFDLSAVLDDDLFRLKFKAASKIEKYAVIGPKPWMRNILELGGAVFPTEIRVFDAEEEAAAWEWVGAQQALLAGK